ncbi:hypothetical protein PAHAL_2G014900 [Panicum hallii]|jgi:hypothetical protein|uniref:Uncharacterized protein n=1 Tax=Panicum hallii TaxID=206008 RepID=A0A2S3GVI9_9POAL|nr:hypothetical protein PAHAL_2G014900 [Panicum hallii]
MGCSTATEDDPGKCRTADRCACSLEAEEDGRSSWMSRRTTSDGTSGCEEGQRRWGRDSGREAGTVPRRLSATSWTVRDERTRMEDGGHLQQPNPRREIGRNGPSGRRTAAVTGCTDREDEDGRRRRRGRPDPRRTARGGARTAPRRAAGRRAEKMVGGSGADE